MVQYVSTVCYFTFFLIFFYPLFCLETPFAALTGTADADTCSIVISTLCLKDPLMVHISPNRNNLCFAIIVSTRKDAMFAELDWLVHHIKEKGHGQLTTKQLYFATP